MDGVDETGLVEPSVPDAVETVAPLNVRALAPLAVVLAAVDTVVFDAAEGNEFPYPPLVLAYALIFSQVSLAAIWAGLISRSPLLGLLGLALTYAVAVASFNVLHEDDGEWGLFLIVQMAAVVLPLLAARLIGIRLSREARYCGPGSFRVKPIQFTLRRLFAVTTSAAILLAFGRIIAQQLPPMAHWADVLTLGGGFASIALLATWASLGIGRLHVRLGVLAAGSLTIGWLFTRMMPTNPKDVVGVFGLVAGDCCLLAALLAFLRRRGLPAGEKSRRGLAATGADCIAEFLTT